MVRPTLEELMSLKKIKDKYGYATYAEVIKKIEEGFDLKQFCDECSAYLYWNHVPFLFLCYIVYAVTGIILSRKDCDEKYCYNVNQFLWVYYGCICLGYSIAVILDNTILSKDKSEFMHCFCRIYGYTGDISCFSFRYIGLFILGIIIHVIYMTYTNYLLGPQLCMILVNCVYVAISVRVTKTLTVYYDNQVLLV